MSVYAVDKLMAQSHKLAADFRQMTGQPLPVTAEIANFDAARLLDLEIIQPPPGGYDAMSVARFRHIATLMWCREEGAVDDDEVWEKPQDL